MEEDTGQAQAATVATTEAPEGYVNADGTLVDDWQNRLTDKTLHDDATLKSIKHVESLAKSYVHVRKQVPMDKVVLPGVNATEGDWNEFYTTIGRPETPEDYQFEVPEGLEDYYDDPLIQEARVELHKVGLTQKQMEIVMALDRKRLELGIKQMQDDTEKEKTDMITALRNKWGGAYDERLHLANRMISENTQEGEQREKILARVGNDPYVADFLANIASKFVEHKIITDIETPNADLNAKKKELMGSKAYMDGKHPAHKDTVAAVKRIFEQLSKLQTTTVGTG